MRGVSAVITALLLLLLAIAAAAMFFSFMSRLESEMVSEGESKMIDLDVPPKLLSLVCYDGYGYMLLSLSQGQGTVTGSMYYTVELDTGQQVSDGFINTTLEGSTYVYIPYLFDTNERYLVSLGGKRWKLSEYCRPVNDPHMVLYLNLDEGSGATAGDSSYYENDGTITGSLWVGGKQGYALELDGSDDKIVVTNSDELQNYTSFTVGLWFKYTGRGPLDKAYHSLINKNPVGLGYGDPYHIWVVNSTRDLQARVGNGSSEYQLNSNIPVNDSNYHYTALTYDGELYNYSLYLDGVAVANLSVYSGWIPTQNTGGVNVGLWSVYLNYFNGTVDEVRIYDRLLSGDEVLSLYQAYVGGR